MTTLYASYTRVWLLPACSVLRASRSRPIRARKTRITGDQGGPEEAGRAEIVQADVPRAVVWENGILLVRIFSDRSFERM